MRKLKIIEWLYLDFDGFFTDVERYIYPSPILWVDQSHALGVIDIDNTCKLYFSAAS